MGNRALDDKFEKFLEKHDKGIRSLCKKYLYRYPSLSFSEIYSFALTHAWRAFQKEGEDIHWGYIKKVVDRGIGKDISIYFDTKIVNKEIDNLASKYSLEEEIVYQNITERAIKLAKKLAANDLSFKMYVMWLKGMTYREIAKELNMIEETVKRRILRLRRRIHPRLKRIYSVNADKFNE